jgi:hypothetical protein
MALRTHFSEEGMRLGKTIRWDSLVDGLKLSKDEVRVKK